MERLVFRSLANPELAYTWNRCLLDWNLRSGATILSEHAGMFQVFNDWPVQHSPESGVSPDRAADFLRSLAIHLRDNPADVEIIAGGWPSEHEGGDMPEFALSVKYREGKRTYYSRTERKVSASESKRNDRRWDEVPQYADGSLAGVFSLSCNGGYRSLLDRYQLALNCAATVVRHTGHSVGYDAAEQLAGMDYKTAALPYRTVHNLVMAFRLTHEANRWIATFAPAEEVVTEV